MRKEAKYGFEAKIKWRTVFDFISNSALI